jgi:hypothetical protein
MSSGKTDGRGHFALERVLQGMVESRPFLIASHIMYGGIFKKR